MATVDKNFRIKNGLVVEGTTATVNGNNILTESAGDSYILNLVGGSTLVKSVDLATFTVDGSGNLTVNSGVFDAYGAASSAQTAAQSYADGLASNYDPAGAASSAQTAAQSYADGLAGNYDPAGAASSALSSANTYTDGAITNLVDGAPDLLNTLRELAQAIDNDASYASTLTTALGGKQDNLTASTGITIDGSNNISVTANTYDAYGAASTAESNANGYTDSAISAEVTRADGAYDPAGAASTAQSNAESYTDSEVTNLKNATTAFTGINVNNFAKEIAVQATYASSGANATIYTWNGNTWGSAKLIVKFKTSSHTQISEYLMTIDAAGNISVTQYGEVSTNGELGSLIISNPMGGNFVIQPVTNQANTDVTMFGTLIK